MNQYYRPTGFGGFSFFPPVIKNLLIINAIVFLVQLIGSGISFGGLSLANILTKYFALIPVGGIDVGMRGLETISWNFYPWQLITYQFMHGGFGHIFFNMFALWMFGMEIENMWGSKKFLYFYLLCGAVAGLFQLFITPLFTDMLGPTIGASGAVYGVLVAFGLLFPNRYIYLYFFIPVKAKYLIGFLIILQILLFDQSGSNVAYLAHLGGALTGFLFILFDPNIHAEFKNLFGGGSFKTPMNPFGNIKEKFKQKTSSDRNISDANYYDIKEDDDKEKISQQEIDRILDKISESGYQNLTEKEKKILFEASKKMK